MDAIPIQKDTNYRWTKNIYKKNRSLFIVECLSQHFLRFYWNMENAK